MDLLIQNYKINGKKYWGDAGVKMPDSLYLLNGLDLMIVNVIK